MRRTFATYVDVEGIELVFIRISPGPNNALLSGLLWAEKASFLFRVAPGPNSALLRGLPWACSPKELKL